METQVVIAKLAATIYVEAEDPEAAKRIVEKKFADIQGELGGLQVHVGFQDAEAELKAFTEGTDAPGDEDD